MSGAKPAGAPRPPAPLRPGTPHARAAAAQPDTTYLRRFSRVPGGWRLRQDGRVTVLDAPGGGQAGALRVGETVYPFAAPVGTEEALRAVLGAVALRGLYGPGAWAVVGAVAAAGSAGALDGPGEPFLP